jgi:hypothetical protein
MVVTSAGKLGQTAGCRLNCHHGVTIVTLFAIGADGTNRQLRLAVQSHSVGQHHIRIPFWQNPVQPVRWAPWCPVFQSDTNAAPIKPIAQISFRFDGFTGGPVDGDFVTHG